LTLPDISEDYFVVEWIDYNLPSEKDWFLELNKIQTEVVDLTNIVYDERYLNNEWKRIPEMRDIFSKEKPLWISWIKLLYSESKHFMANLDTAIDLEKMTAEIDQLIKTKVFQHETPGELLPSILKPPGARYISDQINLLSIYNCLEWNNEKAIDFLIFNKEFIDIFFPKAWIIVTTLLWTIIYEDYLKTIELDLQLCDFSIEELEILKNDNNTKIDTANLILNTNKQEYFLAKKGMEILKETDVDNSKFSKFIFDEEETLNILKFLYKKIVDGEEIDFDKLDNGSYWFDWKYEYFTLFWKTIPWRKNYVGRYQLSWMISRLSSWEERVIDVEKKRQDMVNLLSNKIEEIKEKEEASSLLNVDQPTFLTEDIRKRIQLNSN